MKKGFLYLTLIFLVSAIIMGGCEMNEHGASSVAESILETPKESSQISESVSEDISVVPPANIPGKPQISLEKEEFSAGEAIFINFENTDAKDWIGFYPEGVDPGTINSIVWQYSVGNGTVRFNVNSLPGAGVYWVFLCDNDGYAVLDMKTITVLDSDTADYGVRGASITVTTDGLYRSITAKVIPSSEKTLTYKFYWSKGEKRLSDYEPIYTCTHSGKEEFTVNFNDCLFMPDEADGIEIAVAKGRSQSKFISAPENLKVPESKLLYKFNVITDLHITSSRPQHQSHLTMAFDDIIAQGGSAAIFTVGDNTDRGAAAEYDILLDIVASAGEKLPQIYYAIGNHDVVYGSGYDKQISLFKEKTGMPGAYYSAEINGSRFIVLGSDTAVGEGTVGKKQLDWLKSELEKTDKSKPVFLFLHQPLIDTVSGSLYSQDKVVQDWFGIVDSADEIREMLKDYPNAILFSGHTHWTLESKQPILAGCGKDANFVNCASVGYLWNDNDESTGGSEGYYIEVYEDYVLLRGREFLKGNWCAAAQFIIPITGE